MVDILDAKLRDLGAKAERALKREGTSTVAAAQLLADLKRARNEVFALLDEVETSWEDASNFTPFSVTARGIKDTVECAMQVLEEEVGLNVPKVVPKVRHKPAVRNIPSFCEFKSVDQAYSFLLKTTETQLSDAAILDDTAQLISMLRSLSEDDFERFRSDVGQENQRYRILYEVCSSLSSDVEEVASNDRDAWLAFAQRARQAWRHAVLRRW